MDESDGIWEYVCSNELSVNMQIKMLVQTSGVSKINKY